jgi:ADP-heptose:LPS heptosyltransferase
VALRDDRPSAFVLRALGLGDLLTAVPALRAVRRLLPEHRLMLGCPGVYEPLIRLADCADQICPMSGLSEPAPSGSWPDVAIDLHGRGPQSHRLLAAMHPRRLVAFGCEGFDGPVWTPDEHEVRRWCRLVAESFDDADVDPTDLLLSRPDVPPPVERAVVIHPGAAHEARRWPVERFAEVAAWAAGAGPPVVLTGSPDEIPLTRAVAAAAGLHDNCVLAGRLTLAELAALVSVASLVVCGDTGVAHLASAYQRPSVVLFGPISPQLWGPPASGPHVALWKGESRGDPWGSELDPALASISADEVIDAAQRLLVASRPQ